MLNIVSATIKDSAVISKIGAQSFIESHGKSASEEDIANYVADKFSLKQLENEFSESNAIFKLAYYNNEAIGYSKLVINCPNPSISTQPVCKLERLYILESYLDKKIGQPLFEVNVNLAKSLNQKGMWLYVWTGNPRALRFYEKQGFKIISETYFKISEKHSNPNYWLYLDL